MANVNLSRMNIESLMDLREQVDERLREHRVELQKQSEWRGSPCLEAREFDASDRSPGGPL